MASDATGTSVATRSILAAVFVVVLPAVNGLPWVATTLIVRLYALAAQSLRLAQTIGRVRLVATVGHGLRLAPSALSLAVEGMGGAVGLGQPDLVELVAVLLQGRRLLLDVAARVTSDYDRRAAAGEVHVATPRRHRRSPPPP